ncbi:MAG: GrdX family protein [Oscillospiraceae bacterium]|nr:GrdX family protein [Oscillospiraceae bacterium]
MDILVTNNPLVLDRCKSCVHIEYLDAPLIDVLVRVRDLVHLGHALRTHPLSGSIKPNETLYKSVLVSGKHSHIDKQSVHIAGACVLKAQSFPLRVFNERVLYDMQIVDLSLISSALSSCAHER